MDIRRFQWKNWGCVCRMRFWNQGFKRQHDLAQGYTWMSDIMVSVPNSAVTEVRTVVAQHEGNIWNAKRLCSNFLQMLEYAMKTHIDNYKDVPVTGVRKLWKPSQEGLLKVIRRAIVHSGPVVHEIFNIGPRIKIQNVMLKCFLC